MAHVMAARDEQALRLASGELHTWCASLDVPPETSARLSTTLSPGERDRSARFLFERDRQRFVIAHGLLRELLGRYLGVEPDQIRYVYSTSGKPDLGPEFGGRLRFSLSHSADLALVAVAAGSRVGVDVEQIRALPDYEEIARRFFPAGEADELAAAEMFLGCWTKKEAYLKARGESLASLGTALPASGWSFYALQPAPGYIGALAVEGSGWRLLSFSF